MTQEWSFVVITFNSMFIYLSQTMSTIFSRQRWGMDTWLLRAYWLVSMVTGRACCHSAKGSLFGCLVGGLEHEFCCSRTSWEVHHPNCRTHIFERGRYTTNQLLFPIFFTTSPGISKVAIENCFENRSVKCPEGSSWMIPKYRLRHWPWPGSHEDGKNRRKTINISMA